MTTESKNIETKRNQFYSPKILSKDEAEYMFLVKLVDYVTTIYMPNGKAWKKNKDEKYRLESYR